MQNMIRIHIRKLGSESFQTELELRESSFTWESYGQPGEPCEPDRECCPAEGETSTNFAYQKGRLTTLIFHLSTPEVVRNVKPTEKVRGEESVLCFSAVIHALNTRFLSIFT